MRLFFAISLTESVREQIGGLSAPIAGVRWIPTASLHLTLQFIGEVDDSMTSKLRETPREISSSRFTLDLHGVGAFPNERRPKVLWAGCRAPDRLMQLHEDLLTSLQSLKLDLDTRPFRPHITIARVRRYKRPILSSWLDRYNDFQTEVFDVRAFHLYSSELRSNGAVYHILESYSLADRRSIDEHSD